MAKKILIAEDEEFLLRAYKEGLIEAGFKVDTAKNGEEALELLRKEPPDLMLIDLIMPVKNGFETLEEISKDEKLKKVPVIILSNLGQDSDIEKGKKLGVLDYLVKANCSMEDVVATVKKYIK